MSVFQSNFCCFAVYVAKHLKLFEKHGVDVELVYGTGIQPANIFVSGSADAGAFAVEHGVTVSSKGQDLKLIVLEQKLPPLSLIVRNDVPTPNADKPYPQNLMDMKGLKIGISGRGASTDTAVRFMLQAGRPRSGQGRHHHAGRRSRHHAGLAQEQGDRRRHGGRADPDRRGAVAQDRQDRGRHRRRRRPGGIPSLRL